MCAPIGGDVMRLDAAVDPGTAFRKSLTGSTTGASQGVRNPLARPGGGGDVAIAGVRQTAPASPAQPVSPAPAAAAPGVTALSGRERRRLAGRELMRFGILNTVKTLAPSAGAVPALFQPAAAAGKTWLGQ